MRFRQGSRPAQGRRGSCPPMALRRGVIAGARNLLRSTTALSAVAAACAWYVPQAAEAACLPTSPASGGTVTCSPNQDGNYAVSNLNSLTVQILPGASINGTFVATGIGTLTFLNSGSTNGLVTLDTTTSLVFQNSGVINQGLMITAAGTSSITNDAGHTINGTFQISGDGAHTITNGGRSTTASC